MGADKHDPSQPPTLPPRQQAQAENAKQQADALRDREEDQPDAKTTPTVAPK